MKTLDKSLLGLRGLDGDGSDSPLGDFWANFLQANLGRNPLSTFGNTAAVGDLGTIASLASGGSGKTSTSGTAGSAPSPTQVTTAGSSLIINLTWDTSVSGAPAGFMTDMIAAAHYLESQISSAVTINLEVGYNEVAGSSLSSGALGESESNIVSVSYSALVAALKATASTDATDASLLASLPATSPVSGKYWVTTAQAKALGLSAANGTSLDGAIGFGSSSEFTYGDTNTTGSVASGTYDFYATALHEISEVMGRLLLVGQTINGSAAYSLLDLMHYSAAGVHDYTQSTPGYFSVNGGASNLGNFNTIAGGDPGDWASSVKNDAFDAYATPGVLETAGTNDLTALDAIGWNLTTANTSPPPATPPTGISLAPATSWLSTAQGSTGLTGSAQLATITQVGGIAGDSFTYQLGGSSAASFSLTASGSSAILATGRSGLSGKLNGALYTASVTATDATKGVSSTPVPLNVVVGSSSGDTVNLAAMGSIVTSATSLVFGLAGNDTINGSGMSGMLFIDGGAGADTMTGGTGGNHYEYGATSDSTASSMDIISNFNVLTDVLDFTGLGVHLGTAAALGSSASSVAADSIGWQTSGGNTFVYVNTSSRSEALTATNMKLELRGAVTLTSADIQHV